MDFKLSLLRKTVAFVFVAVLSVQFTQAQSYSFGEVSHLSIPTSETYKIIQDRKGYIWVATDLGLYRHHLAGTTLIGENEPAATASVLTVFECSNGIILYSTIQGKIFKVEGLTAVELNFEQTGNPLLASEIVYRFQEDTKGNIYIHSYKNTYRTNYPFDRLTPLSDHISHQLVIDSSNGILLANNSFAINWVPPTPDSLPIKIRFNRYTQLSFTHPVPNDAIGYFRVLSEKWGDYWAISYCRTLFLIGPDKKLKKTELPADIISLRTDRSQRLWVGVYKNGFYQYEQPGQLRSPKRGLNGWSVSDFCIDREGGIWATTLEKSVFYAASTGLLKHSLINSDEIAYRRLIEIPNGIVANSFQEKNKLIDSTGTISNWNPAKLDAKATLSLFAQTEQADWYFSRWLVQRVDRLTGKIEKTKISREFLNSVQVLRGDTLLVLANGHLGIIENRRVRFYALLPESGYFMLLGEKRDLLVGTRNGIYYAADFSRPGFKKVKGATGRVVKMLKSSDGDFWILVQGEGLFRYSNGLLKRVLKSTNQERFFDALLVNKTELWISSNKGVYAYKLQPTDKNGETVLDQATYISNKYAYAMARLHGRIFMSTPEGLLSLPIETFEKPGSTFSIYLSSWMAGDSTIKFSNANQPQRFRAGTSRLSWSFDIAAYQTTEIQLKYRLTGAINDSGLLNGNNLLLNNLVNGDYQLQVWAERADKVNSNLVSISFFIQPKFWQTPVFLAVGLTLFAFLLLFTYHILLKRARRNEEAKRKIDTELVSSRLMALQAQMNPHFVYNAINSIQLLVLEEKTKEAYFYLTEFSRLIRRILQQSNEALVSLDDELETLRLYVAMETLRFSSPINYELEIEDSINRSTTRLPTMILQPLVENAIRHGLAEKNAPARLLLKIDSLYTEDRIRIGITDNGLGRRPENESLKTNSLSMSMKVLEERIAKLNKLYATDRFGFDVIDLMDEQGQPLGTTVNVYIPCQY